MWFDLTPAARGHSLTRQSSRRLAAALRPAGPTARWALRRPPPRSSLGPSRGRRPRDSWLWRSCRCRSRTPRVPSESAQWWSRRRHAPRGRPRPGCAAGESGSSQRASRSLPGRRVEVAVDPFAAAEKGRRSRTRVGLYRGPSRRVGERRAAVDPSDIPTGRHRCRPQPTEWAGRAAAPRSSAARESHDQ